MKNVLTKFCPFRNYLRVQHNISDIFERFSISSCNKKMKTQETFKKNSGYMSVRRVINDFLIFTLSKTVKYVLHWWMKKVWPEFCPFRTYLRVQHNISDIFERFSISSCNKKMKTQETFKKNSGYMNVRRVTNDFLIITLLKTCQICTSVMNEKSQAWILSLQNLFEGTT